MAKFTVAKIKEQTKKIQETIQREKRYYREQNFTEVTPGDFAKKLNSAIRLYSRSATLTGSKDA
jgi:hypothetical protein